MKLTGERCYSVATIAIVVLSARNLGVPVVQAYDTDDRAEWELTRALEDCVDTTGHEYSDARERVLRWDAERVQSVLADLAWSSGSWERLLVGRAIRMRLEHPEECASFDAMLERWIEKSWTSHVRNRPVSARVGTFCRKSISETPALEAIVLERLFKYDNPAHVEQGILKALGHAGTSQSLDPLIALMKSQRGPCAQRALSVGNVSKRLGDTRAVPDLVQLYRSRPRRHGTGLPEEELRAMAPWPQVALASALRSIGGEKALRALEELHADETHAALKEQLEKAIGLVRDAIEETRKDDSPGTSRETPVDADSADE